MNCNCWQPLKKALSHTVREAPMKTPSDPTVPLWGLPTALKNLRVPELRFHTACGSQDITTHSTFNSNGRASRESLTQQFISLKTYPVNNIHKWILISYRQHNSTVRRILGALNLQKQYQWGFADATNINTQPRSTHPVLTSQSRVRPSATSLSSYLQTKFQRQQNICILTPGERRFGCKGCCFHRITLECVCQGVTSHGKGTSGKFL